jgi:hypothetical protein
MGPIRAAYHGEADFTRGFSFLAEYRKQAMSKCLNILTQRVAALSTFSAPWSTHAPD